MALDMLEARISHVKYHKPSKWNPSGTPFLIASTDIGAIVKGEMSRPSEGERYRFYGAWKDNNVHGPAFEFHDYEIVIDRSAGGMAQYLSRHIRGLGPSKSEAIVVEFGEDTLRTLRDNPELASRVPGISEAIIVAIRKHFEEHPKRDPVAYARLIDLFAGHKIPRKVIDRLIHNFKSGAPEFILDNPYKLLDYPRMGWATVDSWAMAVAGHDRLGVDRHRSAIVEGLKEISRDGHTFASRIDIEEKCYRLMDCVPRPEAWELAEKEGKIVCRRACDESGVICETFAVPDLDSAEIEVSECLAELLRAARPLVAPLDVSGLNEAQEGAARLIESSGVSILCGPRERAKLGRSPG